MDMDAAMEEEFTGSSNDHMMIVKGRRTKRLRQTSPLRAVVTIGDIKLIMSSSSSDGGGGDHGERGDSISSEISTTTEEDEDMANCLILLAQSGSSPRQVEQQQKEVKMERISSRRFTQMATTTGKAGIFVYECKTCNRTFPSFQALGGHRASHKKPKHMVEEKKVSNILDEGQISATTITPAVDDHHDEEHHEEGKTTRHLDPVPVLIQLTNKTSLQKRAIENLEKLSGVNKAKIHECSICGSEFSSGQALGGHMRRHRNIPTGNQGLTMNNMDTSTIESSSSHDGERPRNILQLDLNLPAPEDDQHHDSKFQFSANQQHLFSSPALVDCHY